MLLQDDHAVVQDLSKKPEHLPGKGLVYRLKNDRTKKKRSVGGNSQDQV